jgi:hypothetical protein
MTLMRLTGRFQSRALAERIAVDTALAGRGE